MKWHREELHSYSTQQNYLEQRIHIVGILMDDITFVLNMSPQK
jgi:hypothetical protein